MRNKNVIALVALAALVVVSASIFYSRGSGLKGSFGDYGNRNANNVYSNPQNRAGSARQIPPELLTSRDAASAFNDLRSQINAEMYAVTYDANGFSNLLSDDSKVTRAEFLHAIVTVLNPPNIDSYAQKCKFTGTDLSNAVLKRDFCYIILKVIAPGFEDFVPKFNNQDPSKSIYDPNVAISRKDAANLIAEAFMGGKANGLEYWDYLTNLSKGGYIGYCTTTKYADVQPDSNPPGKYGGNPSINLLFYTTSALIKSGILPEPSQVPKSDKNAQNYAKCHLDNFEPQTPLSAFHAKLWVDLAKKDIEKQYWMK